MSIKEKKKLKKKNSLRKRMQVKKLEYWVPVYSNGDIVAYAAVPLDKKKT
jgi:hypothetical protein